MSGDGMEESEAGGAEVSALRGSARGWHGVQLAVIGFIGLCGALQRGAGTDAPRIVQTVAVTLVLLALALSCAGVAIVAAVAWPMSVTSTDPRAVGAGVLRLRRGVGLSFAAVALVALATVSGWWPRAAVGESGSLLQVSVAGGSWCGTATPGSQGELHLTTSQGPVNVAFADIAAIDPVASCS